MKSKIKMLEGLIKIAKEIGLPEEDLKNAREFLNHGEYGLCFDTIITQLYEFDIEIDEEFYDLLKRLGNQMKLSDDSFLFMKDLIRGKNKIPKPVKDSLARILDNLK